MDTMYINNTNLARQLRENIYEPIQLNKKKEPAITGLECKAFVGKTKTADGEMKDINVTARLTLGSIDALIEPFEPFDFLVLDAIYTLYHDKYMKFSLHDVLRVITYNEKVALTPKRSKQIKNSIYKMIGLKIAINAKNEASMRKLPSDKIKHLSEYNDFLPVTRLTGADIENTKYEINSNLPIYEYAEKINRQIIAVPKILFVCDDKAPERLRKELSNTIDAIMLKRYIICRTEIMRNQRNRLTERRINYKSMLDKLCITREKYGSETAFLHKCRKVHNKMLALLEYFKTIGYIEDFKITTLALGDISGVEVKGKIVNPQNL